MRPDGIERHTAIAVARDVFVDRLAGYIRRAFLDAGVFDFLETEAATVRAGHLIHLCSRFSAPAATLTSAILGRLLRDLHPTPAVCGLPKDTAKRFLGEREGYDRGAYTGYLGPVGINGETALYVNLRTSMISGDSIYIYVGGGLVEASDPALEWQEAVEKAKIIGQIL